jgi:hypothetical protein
MGFVEAKKAVSESETWRDARETMDAEIQSLMDDLPHANDHPDSESKE